MLIGGEANSKIVVRQGLVVSDLLILELTKIMHKAWEVIDSKYIVFDSEC